MLRAYWLLALGLVGVALASTAAVAPAKASKAKPADKKDDKAKPADNGGKAKPVDDGKSAKPDETKGAGEQDNQKGEQPATKPEAESGSSAKANESGAPSDETEESTPPPPPPAPPRADEQNPRPYLKLPEPEKPSRQVELGAHVGMEYLPARGSALSYGPGFAWGGHARIEIAPWMGFRISFTQSSQPVSVPDGALGLQSGTRIDQPDLSVLLLRARIEPTWVVSPRLRLWAGIGAGWGRVSAPALTTSGTQADLNAAQRKGVMLEFSGGLGGSFDVIPNWLAASLMVSGGFLTNQTGEVFTSSQAFTADGHRTQLAGLPHFSSSLSALFGVSVLL